MTINEKIYCISAKMDDLPNVVARKIEEGFVAHDEPVKVGNGVMVQMMVWRGGGNYLGVSCETASQLART